MAVLESNITICGHGSGRPSKKNLKTYNSSRYSMKAKNGKRKGVVAVKRLKALTDAGREKFHDAYKTILGRNIYSQTLRGYVYTPYKKKYYSDCSSSGMATLKKIGYAVTLLNTAGIYTSSLFETVPVKIKDGHIENPEVLKVGDAILYVGSDPARPLQIGHVEWVYEIPKSTVKKVATAETKKTTKEIALEVIDGLWGTGEERKKKLTSAGYEPDEIQTEVNQILNNKKSVDEIVTEVINGKWGTGEERKKKLTSAGYDPEVIQAAVNKKLKA